MITLNGLILREYERGETSKSICVLTAEMGIIYVFIRGGQKSSKNASASQLFSYSKLCIEEKKDSKGQASYFLNSSEPVKLFYDIRLDAKKVALGSYFCDLLQYSGIESTDCGEIMRLALNTFYYLNEGSVEMEQLKSIFELRLLCDLGMTPKLLCCSHCFKATAKRMHYNFLSNELECDDCCYNPKSAHDIVLLPSVLYTIRHIALTDMDKLYKFRVTPRCQRDVTRFTESYVKYNLKNDLASLEFYRML